MACRRTDVAERRDVRPRLLGFGTLGYLNLFASHTSADDTSNDIFLT
jgi:hypothetical protein